MSSPDPIRRIIPCLLTVSRLLILPILFWQFHTLHFCIALLLYLLAILTDVADGYLARRWHAITHFGTLLDPIVDKLFLLSSIGFFTWNQRIPIFFIALLGFRFLGQIFLFIWIRWKRNLHYPYKPHILTKVSAFCCYALLFTLLMQAGYPELGANMRVLQRILLWSCTGLELVILVIFVPDVLRFGLQPSREGGGKSRQQSK